MAVNPKSAAMTGTTVSTTALGYEYVKTVALAWVTGIWTPEAYDAAATIMAVVGVAVGGALITAWTTVTKQVGKDLEQAAPLIAARVKGSGLVARLWKWLSPVQPRVTPDPANQIIPPLERGVE
jgi:hypothetical protein